MKSNGIRERISAMIIQAGEAGCSLAELSAKDKANKRLIRWYLNDSPIKICVRGMTRSTVATRYFALGLDDVAAAYVAKHDAKERPRIYTSAETAQKIVAACKGGETVEDLAAATGVAIRTVHHAFARLVAAGRLQVSTWPGEKGGRRYRFWPAGAEIPPRPAPKQRVYAGRNRKSTYVRKTMHARGSIQPGSRKHRVLEMLKQRPDGMLNHELSAELGVKESSVSTTCSELGKSGLIAGVLDPIGKAHQRRRWCMPEFAEAVRAQINRVAPGSAERKKAHKQALIGPADYSRAKVTIAPTPEPRFHVETPEPVFSAMRPGSYLQADTWTARAYA